MAKSKRELEIALLKIQLILLEAEAGIYINGFQSITLENANDNDFRIEFKNPDYE